MATVKGVNRTKIDAMSPANFLANEPAGGGLRLAYDEYVAAALPAADAIEVCMDLPKDAIIVDWRIDHGALGALVTLAFGTKASAAALMAAVDSASAGKKTMSVNGVSLSTGYVCDDVTAGAEKTKLIITTAGAAATGTIKVLVIYATKS